MLNPYVLFICDLLSGGDGLFAERVVSNKEDIECISVGEQLDCVYRLPPRSGSCYVAILLCFLLLLDVVNVAFWF